jgi:hypothetical protein
MAQFKELREFERRFEAMEVDELNRWKAYWTQHAQHLAPKIRRQAMKRVLEIEKAIQRKSLELGEKRADACKTSRPNQVRSVGCRRRFQE